VTTYLVKHAPAVEKAKGQAPKQWQHWFLVTAVGQMIFLPLIFFMAGPWTPAAGRRRDEELEAGLHQDDGTNRIGADL
jgi:MFS transporter, ACS family, D-galactonate transporter